MSTIEDLTQQHALFGRQLDYLRYLSLVVECQGQRAIAAQRFPLRYPRSTNVGLVEKAAQAPGTTVDATWAGPLAAPQPLAEAFLSYVRPLTIIGRLPLKKVPFNVSLPQQTGAGTYGWVTEACLKRVGKASFATVVIGVAKCTGIFVVSDELMK